MMEVEEHSLRITIYRKDQIMYEYVLMTANQQSLSPVFMHSIVVELCEPKTYKIRLDAAWKSI